MTDYQNKHYTSRVGQRGQITLPQALREELGIKPGQYVEVALVRKHEGSYLEIKQRVPLLLKLAGSVRPLPEGPLEWGEIQDRAWQAQAEHIAREGLADEEGVE